MSRTSKILISILGSLIISVTVFFVYLSTQINTETIKKVIVQQIENNLKDSIVNINSVSYSFGRKITFHISQLNIDQPNNKALAVNDIKVKVPIYSILTRGGAVDIVINKPNVFLLDVNGKMNWELFFQTDQKETTKKVKIKVPSFLEQSRINLKVNNLSLRILDQKLKIPVDKILLKNISLEKMTAFDLSSQLDLEYENKKINMHYDVVGETMISDFIEARDTKVNFMMSFKNIYFNNLKLPNTKMKGLVTLNKNNNITFFLRNDIETVLSGEVKGSLTESATKLSVETFNQKIIINNALKILPKINNTFKGYSNDNIELEANGTFKFDISKKEFVPYITYKTIKPFNLVFEKYKFNIDTKGSLQKNELNSETEIKTLQGSVLTQFNTVINNNTEEITNLSTVNVDVFAKNLKINIPRLELESSNSTEVVNSAENKAQYPVLNLPKISIGIKGENNQVNNLSFETNGQINAFDNKIEIKSMRNIINEKGIVASSAKIEINPTKIKLNSTTEMTSVDMNLFNSFFPSNLGKTKGHSNGKLIVKGSLDEIVINGDVKLLNGKVEDLDLNDYVLPVLKEYKINIKKQKSLNLSSGFEVLTSKFLFKDETINIERLNLNTAKSELKLRGSGKLGLKDTINSKIYLDVINNEVSKELRVKTGKSELPLLLKGDGFVVTPDLNYTLGKISKRILKQQKKQIKKNIEQEKKKIKKKLEDKTKNLLKGIKL